MDILRKLNYLLDKKMKIRSVMVFILIVLGSVAELAGVSIILPIVELAMDEKNMETSKMAQLVVRFTGVTECKTVLWYLIIITLAIYGIKIFYMMFMTRQVYGYAATTKRTLASRLLKAYLKQPYSFFLNKNSSELIRSVNADTGQLYTVIYTFFTLLSNLFTAVFIVGALAVTNIVMTIIVAGLMGVSMAVIIFLMQNTFKRLGDRRHDLDAFLLKHLQQAFGGIKEIKILNSEKQFAKKYDDVYKENTAIDVKFSISSILPKYLIETICIMGILGYLGYEILYNPNYIEVVPQLSVFCVAAFKLLPCMNAINNSANTVLYNKAAIDLVYNDIKMANELEKTGSLEVLEGDEVLFNDVIRLQDVSFKYDGADENVLNNIDIDIKKGQSVAFIGASGGGKTTTADIVLSLLEPVGGKVTVDGKDIKDNVVGWRKKFGYIPQTIYLIDDTIRNNIAFGIDEQDIDDDKIWDALSQAQLKEFVQGLKDGLDTVVGERGARISGGQRQRLGIARALYLNPEILVFDEATSALDNETEKEVMSAIDGLQGKKTMLMIAHRLSTIENCDVIYKIEKGHVEKVKG